MYTRQPAIRWQDEAGIGLSNEELLLRAYDGKVPAAFVQRMFDYGRHLLSARAPIMVGRQICRAYGMVILLPRGPRAITMTKIFR